MSEQLGSKRRRRQKARIGGRSECRIRAATFCTYVTTAYLSKRLPEDWALFRTESFV